MQPYINQTNSNKKTVIIIDDERDARETIKQHLLSYSWLTLVCECENGKEAVTSINSLKPDIVFLDVRMPALNGFQVIGQLNYRPHIIITTGFQEYAAKAFDHDAVDYLLKPFTIKRFDTAIVKAMLAICDAL